MSRKNHTPGDFNLAVRRSRTGLGLFAAQPIPKGACVIEYTGKPLTEEEYAHSNSRYLFDVGRGKVIDGSPRWNRARYINHSCVPNCEVERYKGRIFIYALRNIEAGEELAYNYGEEYFNDLIGDKCRCPKCMPELELKMAAARAYSPSRSEPAGAR